MLARLDRIERRLDFAGAAPASPAPPAPAAPSHPPAAPERGPAEPPKPRQAADEPAPQGTAVAAAEATADRPPGAAVESVPEPLADAGALAVTDLRRLWPDVIALAKDRKRVTWMLLSQGSQVVSVEGSVLTLGFHEKGARDMFLNSGHDEIVRQLLIDRIGRDYTVEAVVSPGQANDPAPAAAPPPPSRQAPAARVAEAREALESPGGPAAGASEPEQDPDADVSPDDPEEQSLAGTELIQQTLGGTVIEEISMTDRRRTT